MPARFHIDLELSPGTELTLPANASRHVQVLRLQPGAPITLFDGRGGEWAAELLDIGRKSVRVRLLTHAALEREAGCQVTLAPGMPANERMDALVEKATELGVAMVVPLVCERSVLRLAGERADRKAAHWQAIAVAACEQSGRNRVPTVNPPRALRHWLAALAPHSPQAPEPSPKSRHALRLLLSLAPEAEPLAQVLLKRLAAAADADARGCDITVLSGPEGGLSEAEMASALACGFVPVSLGPRVLRADTAPLAALALISALAAVTATTGIAPTATAPTLTTAP